MPSTYTKNLGIELPATGEQANTWGITVNRNMGTLDTGINGNTSIQINNSPYPLTIVNGADSPPGANPVIVWTGPQTGQVAVQIDWQSARQHLYFMSNQTSGGTNGFPISFAQSPANSVILQPGRDAIIYTDGNGNTASTTQFLANPQFTSVLAATVQVSTALQLGNVATLTGDAQGNVKFSGGLGVNNPVAIPDPLTVTGPVTNGGQLRLVQNGGYGVIFRNDGALNILITAAGDPYGTYVGAIPFQIDLASRAVGVGGVNAIPGYGLNVNSLHASSIACDGAGSFGGGITGGLTVAGGVNISSGGINVVGRSYFNSGDQFSVGMVHGSITCYIGVATNGQIQMARQDGWILMTVDSTGNVVTTGGLHVLASGITFPDGSVQTTAGGGNVPGNLTVGGVIYGPSSSFQSPVLYCPQYSSNPSGLPANTITFTHNEGSGWVTIWVIRSDGSVHWANIPLTF